MAIRDVLLTLTSYPEPTSVSVIDRAVSRASALGAHLAAIACEVHVQLPGSLVSFGTVGAIAAGEAHRSRDNTQELLTAFETAAQKAGLLHESIKERCITSQLANRLVEYARLRDLTIVPVPNFLDEWPGEAIIFQSGRPTLVLPEAAAAKPFTPDTIMVAWDFSRAAARAVADAMPLLERARQVRVVTVRNEKVIDTVHSSQELAKNLSRHAVDVVLDEVDAAGRGIGEVLAYHAGASKADLLVMGAYGHSRWREFVLGGATASILAKPPLPVLLAH